MDNPLDTAGNAVKNVGEYGSQALFGFARFLEQITGDAVSAAIFAGFLLFAIMLIKGAGLSRNHSLYATAIKNLGIIGIAGYFVYSVIQGIALGTDSTGKLAENAVLQKGLGGGQSSGDSQIIANVWAALSQYFWYGFTFVVMAVVGYIISHVSNKVSSINTHSEPIQSERLQGGKDSSV